MHLRPATAADLPAISAIYAHHVLNGLASFETDAPSLQEMTQRFETITGNGYPTWRRRSMDACSATRTPAPTARGWRIATRSRTRSTSHRRRSAAASAARCWRAWSASARARGYRQMLAVIGDSANLASIVLHQRCGFTQKCVLDAVGFKFGRWVDSVIMQRALGAGASALPT
jgi:L-amino acid N-acyltransferase YncA